MYSQNGLQKGNSSKIAPSYKFVPLPQKCTHMYVEDILHYFKIVGDKHIVFVLVFVCIVLPIFLVPSYPFETGWDVFQKI